MKIKFYYILIKQHEWKHCYLRYKNKKKTYAAVRKQFSLIYLVHENNKQ